ncbi:TniQ family protein [Microbulbifer variabilis]|uniref:TniQ family protein n=1 Tax=Microbulbifer variabilis TaxID=266805 RepID=A0ABY4VE44_9GAMM|nr:TniQ family protein [Microbulbifer variabilis]USD21135.1 TniQ family protein [Microbulbifer variabilis]
MLLSRPFIQPEECLVSYLVRLSEQNGFNHVGNFLHYAGLKWKNNRAPIYQVLTGKFNVSSLLIDLGLSECQSKLTPIYSSFRKIIDTSSVIVKLPKVCPDCLEELGYCKYQWALLPVVVCSKHQKMLVDVSSTSGKRLSWYRHQLNRFDGEVNCIKPNASSVKPSLIEQSVYIESLISGVQSNRSIPVVLRGMSLREVLSLIHFIAHYQVRLVGNSFQPLAMKNQELGQLYKGVWDTLKAWPDSFYAMLEQYIDRPMSDKGQSGLNKHFRDLYERLHRQKENQGIARIKAEFDNFIEEYWPYALDPERITRIKLSSRTRNIISKKEAANILGSRIVRIDKLVQQGRLMQVFFQGKVYYKRNQVESLASEVSSNWTMVEACKALELTRYQLKQLLDAGIIPVLQKPGSLNRDWVINKSQCISFVEDLKKKSRQTEPPLGTTSMGGIQRIGYSIVELIFAMQRGDVEYSVSSEVKNHTSLKQFIAFKVNKIN